MDVYVVVLDADGDATDCTCTLELALDGAPVRTERLQEHDFEEFDHPQGYTAYGWHGVVMAACGGSLDATLDLGDNVLAWTETFACGP